MNWKSLIALTRFAVHRPRTVAVLMVLSLAVPAALALLPTFWPAPFSALNPIHIDTDPENMLSADEPVRVRHNELKREFTHRDIVVVGVINERHPEGVFNVDSLGRVYALTQFARTLKWPDPEDPERQQGVVEVDMIAPSTVDNIEQAGLGAVSFNWLMPEPPQTEAEAVAVREKAQRLPFLNDTLVSGDGQALALYLPLTSKDVSYRVREALLGKIAEFGESADEFHITGLPVAEDTFGVEMFIQMGISAPLAGLVIFIMMWVFFRKLVLIVSPMIVAIVSATTTMALLVATGNTIHIMSSMIPIFVMPIAVLDAIHILSEFFDRYQETRDRRRTVLRVLEALFTPMLFTTLTTAVGFASLALTPIPPVQVFGIFVAVGVVLAWFWTITFIPAFIMFIPERQLADFGHRAGHEAEEASALSRWLPRVGHATYRHARMVALLTGATAAVAAYGISRIQINDNPIKWFTPSHPIRVADEVLNEHFAGTYMAYLAFEPGAQTGGDEPYLPEFLQRLEARGRALGANGAVPGARQVFDIVAERARQLAPESPDRRAFLAALEPFVQVRWEEAPDDRYDAWDEALAFLDAERQRDQIFKQPEVLRYLDRVQAHLAQSEVVGKTTSLSDLVKTVHRELLQGEPSAFRIPDSPEAVAQTLITYQNSHRPQDLWHFVTPDYRKVSLWVQLSSGDNRDMEAVRASLDGFLAENPPPRGLEAHWFGLTYINVIWQEKMVSGMLTALLGSFVVVLVMMVLLFRSVWWGVLSMIPLTVTVGLIYGLVGLLGKDYDMPVAVLSSLSLGLAIDYAIHFLARSREACHATGDWHGALEHVFGEPARAIARNAIVVGVGFLPLLLAPLMPYKTVGVLIAAILLAAGVATLLILPALITLLRGRLFPGLEAAGR